MNLQYSLNEGDFLDYQLFTASKSKNIKAQRLRTLIVMIIAFSFMFAFLYFKTKEFPFLMLFIYIALIFIYKIYEKRRYENHYRKFITENYKNRFGLLCNLYFTEKQIEETSSLGSSQINFDSLVEINEVKNYYYLKLITSQSLIIPKDAINDLTEFENLVQVLQTKYNIKRNTELNWKWK